MGARVRWGYGAIFTTNVLVLRIVAAGVPELQPIAAQTALFDRFVLEGQQLFSRFSTWDPTACGRLVTYDMLTDSFGTY